MLEKALWNNMQETTKRQNQLLDAIINNSKPALKEATDSKAKCPIIYVPIFQNKF